MNWQRIISIIRYGFMNPNQIYKVASRHLGEHLTLNRAVAEEVGCAEAVSFVLLNAGFPIPRGGIAGVLALIDWMKANGFEEVYTPTPGAIITAHSPDPSNQNYAHIGVCLNYGIGSNNSNNGLFQENYTYESWNNYFGPNGSATKYFYHK